MDQISYAFRRLKIEVLKASFLHATLDGAIIVLIINLVLFIAGIGLIRIPISIIIGAVFGFFDFALRFKAFRLKTFEQYNPGLSEILRTAYDNMKRMI